MAVLITGSRGALGSALARLLPTKGHRLALVESPSGRTSETQPDGGITARFDIRSGEAWARELPVIEQSVGPCSGAVLCAGGWRGGQPFHDADDEAWDFAFSSNLDTVRRSLRALLPGMVTRGNGSIVVLGSRSGARPWTGAGSAAYTAAKAAVVALTEVVAAEVRESGVRINALLPSTLDTPANRRAMPDSDPSRWVSCASVAGVVAFLLSPESADISGAALPVYGRA